MKLTSKEARNILEIERKTAKNDRWIEHCICVGDTAGRIAQALKEKGYKGKLINIFSIKPMDVELINNIAQTVKGIVTVENHSIIGGLGGAIAEVLAKNPKHAKLDYIGVPDVFTESGKSSDVKAKYGLNVDNIIEKVEGVMK